MNYIAAKKFIIHKLQTELPTELYYHSLEHTLDVLAVTESLCKQENIAAYHTQLLKTAALFHDSGFTISHLEHEKLGCEIVRNNLPRFNYTPAEIGQICGMIMATKIPQTPLTDLERILSDADLDYLGRKDFHPIAHKLFLELKHKNPNFTESEWDSIQISFLENHHFFTYTNQQNRAPQKALYLTELRTKYQLPTLP